MIDSAIAWLSERLPSSWAVVRGEREAAVGEEGGRVDAFIEVRAPNGTYTTIAVEARTVMRPRDVETMLPGVARSLRALANFVPLLVVAPWLSERTRELLAADGVNYIDLTGNALVKLDNPAIFVQADGAKRNPAPVERSGASIRGPKAARLVRLLADVRPPYTVQALAKSAALTPGYVSRLLDTLDREALITRGRRGAVDDVDVASLLRAWAGSYDVFRRELAARYVAPPGAAETLGRLADAPGPVAVTGSFAAVRLAPVAAPALLAVYCDQLDAVADALGLLPVDDGADIVLIRPFDVVVWARTKVQDGVTFAAPSQVCIDCLTGNGRMPAEGEALLEWMISNEARWRARMLDSPRASES